MLLVRNIIKCILFFQSYHLTTLALGLWPKLRDDKGECAKKVSMGFKHIHKCEKMSLPIGFPLLKIACLQCFKYFQQGLGDQTLSKLGPFKSLERSCKVKKCKVGFHSPFKDLKHKLLAKKWLAIKMAIWLSTTKPSNKGVKPLEIIRVLERSFQNL